MSSVQWGVKKDDLFFYGFSIVFLSRLSMVFLLSFYFVSIVFIVFLLFAYCLIIVRFKE